MAYSGRCLLSGYINKRDPNQGTCTNACRWEYSVVEGKTDEVGNIVNVGEEIPIKNVAPTLGEGNTTNKVFLLAENQRPEEQMSAFEDEHGTYIMNSKDLRAVQHVEKLSQIGVHSLKIEGRTKSFYYCARTAQVYRKAIDDAAAGRPFDESLMDTLESLAHRGYTEGFYAVIRMMNTKIMITGILFLNANNLSANLPVNVMNKVWRKLRLKINSC